MMTMSKNCANCGNVIPDGSAFCPVCGTPVPTGNQQTGGGFCPNCGAQTAPGMVFCGSCGASLNNTQQGSGQGYSNNMQGMSSQDFWGNSSPAQPDNSYNQPQNYGQGYDNSQPQNYGQGYNNSQPQSYGQGYDNSQPQNYGQGYDNSLPQNYGQSYNNSQPQNYGNAPTVRHRSVRSKKLPYIVIAAAALLIAAVVIFVNTIKGKIGGKENIDSGVTASFENLCSMTTLGTKSYVYARMLTEQLLETDLATADPNEVNSLFDECLGAWKAVEEVAGNMTDMSDKLSENDDLDKIRGNDARIRALRNKPSDTGFHFPFAIAASANAPDFRPEDVSNTASPTESVTQCSYLGTQMRTDAQSGYSAVSSLRSVYKGRTTSVSEWQSSVSSVSASFSTEMYVSGQITSGRFTQITNGTHSVHTLSNPVKSGTLGVNNTNVLVDVGSTRSCIVYGTSSGVSMSRDQFGSYNPETNSRTISINTSTASSSETEITFHSTSFFSWFRIDRACGFTITRGNKGETTAITPPDVRGLTVESEGRTPTDIVRELTDGGFNPPVNERGSIDEWIPRISTERITGESHTIISGETTTVTTNTETNHEQNNLTNEQIDQRINSNGAGVGPITVTLVWQTYDDLDLHVITPDGSRIYYNHKTAQGGTLDVDRNAHDNDLTDQPIENIVFPDPVNGHYKIYVRDYYDRTSGYSTHYQVKVRIGETEKMFEGDIDITNTEVFVFEFDYNGHVEGGNDTDPRSNFDETLVSRGARTGKITVSMKWNRYDDVDLHVIAPGDKHIYYSNKTAGGGVLDVDANAGGQRIIDPVENICFDQPSNGHYKVYIHEYNDRSDDSASYVVRVTVDGEVREFTGTIDTTGTQIDIYEFDFNGAEDVTTSTFNGHRYQYYENANLTWTEAREMCRSMGGHLVTITSAEEQAFIESQYPGTTGWIGAYGDEHGWAWVTGEAWDYTCWSPENPDNAAGTEWFGHLWNGMKWNDLDNDDPRNAQAGFYCEFDSLYDTGSVGVPTVSENTNVTTLSGHTYAFYETECTWEQAYELCRSMGGHLATITSAEEQTKITEIITQGTLEGYWIGAKRETAGGSFAWITGESFEYTNWHICQPDYYIRTEEYLMIYRSSLAWNDLDNLSDNIVGKCGYICEWDSVSGDLIIPSNNDNSSVTSNNGHTYAYYETEYTWDDAERYCESVGGHLATITSEEEQNMIAEMISSGRQEGYWLGAKRVTVGGEFSWITNEAFDYRHFHSGQPDYYRSNEEYLMIYRESKGWNDLDLNCDNIVGKCGFICEWDSLNPNVLDERLIDVGAQRGDITISLLWDSYDDLDLHVFTPDGSEIYFSNPEAGGGKLDVDANAGSERKTDPIENIYFAEPASGEYWVLVYNYEDRTDTPTNYLVRVTVGNETQTFSGTINSEGETVDILGFNYTNNMTGSTDGNYVHYSSGYDENGNYIADHFEFEDTE